MRFWGKAKHGDKKTSRERLLCGSDTLEGDYTEATLLMEEGEEKLLDEMFQAYREGLFWS